MVEINFWMPAGGLLAWDSWLTSEEGKRPLKYTAVKEQMLHPTCPCTGALWELGSSRTCPRKGRGAVVQLWLEQMAWSGLPRSAAAKMSKAGNQFPNRWPALWGGLWCICTVTNSTLRTRQNSSPWVVFSKRGGDSCRIWQYPPRLWLSNNLQNQIRLTISWSRTKETNTW